MKRYLVFGFYDYEAYGGFNDFLDDAETMEDAIEIYNNCKRFYDTYEIVDTTTMDIIWRNR